MGRQLRAAAASRLLRAWQMRGRRVRGFIYRYTVFGSAGSRLLVGQGISVVGGQEVTLGVGVSLGRNIDLNSEHADEAGARGRIVIGDRVGIGSGTTLSAVRLIVVEDDVVISPRVFITDHQHTFDDPHTPISRQGTNRGADVRIGRGAWIGVGATIMQGVTIGENTVVGANAVVTRSVPDHAIVAGVPARLVRRVGGQDD